MADIDNSDAALAALQIPPGIYRISVAHPSIESGSIGAETEAAAPDSTSVRQYLTDGESYVTIRPPNAQPDHRQLWRVERGKDGNVVIGRPSDKWPSPFLTYEGAPEKPKAGNRVKLHVFDFPLNEWHLKPVHHDHRFIILVAKSDLGIGVAPQRIFPPFLDLGHGPKDQLVWVFERVHGEAQ